MQKLHYQSCDQTDHEDEFLNMVCIDEKCNKHKLLCVYCVEEHQTCIKRPLKKFIRDFKQQLNSQNIETNSKIEDLIVFYDQIKMMMEQSQKQMNEIFDKSKQTITDTKKMINQFSQQETAKSIQIQKLTQFESTLNQDNFLQLLAEIESFKPNSERFSFSIKKISGHQIEQISERIKNGKLHQLQYQSVLTNLNEQFGNLHETLRRNLQNYFLNAPQKFMELQKLNELQKPIEQEQNESKSIKNQNLFSIIQPPSLLEIQDKEIIAIYDTLEEIEKGNKNNENINTIKKQTNNNHTNNTNNITNNNISNTITSNNNNHQNNYQKVQDQQQISVTDILDNGSSKKQQISDNKQNYQNNSNNQQQSINKMKQQLPQSQKQYPQQQIQQNQTFQKQAQISTTSQIPPKQVVAPSLPIQPQQQCPLIDADENQGEIELNVTQDQILQFTSNQRDITKLLLLSKSVIVGCCGNKIQGFDMITGQKLFTENVETDITDAAYLETDDLNGTLYLATIKGKIEIFIRESNNETSSFILKRNQQQQVDKNGNLLIQLNQQEKQLVILGEEKIIKIYPVKTFKDPKKCDIQDFGFGTALHVDSKFVYVGGNKFLLIWDYINQEKKKIQLSDHKVICIQTHENKLIVGQQDKIKIYERNSKGEYEQTIEQGFGDISTMHILKKWPIVLVSCTQQQQQKICLYNYEQGTSENLQEQKATSCTVREFEKVYHVAFGQDKGQCIIYRIEQTQSHQTQ